MLFPLQHMRAGAELVVAPAGRAVDATAEESPAVERLRPLLRTAGHLDLADHDGWELLRERSRITVGVLIERGLVPEHLRVLPEEPPVVVTRTLLAAWRHATDAPSIRR